MVILLSKLVKHKALEVDDNLLAKGFKEILLYYFL